MSSFLLNPTQRIYSQNQYIHQLFEAQVERSPDAVAVVYEATELTYKELNTKANQLAHYLQSLGVKPEVLVGICVEHSLDMVIGLLGILKAGGAYVPLDPVYPSERLGYMMADAHLSILLTQKHLVSSLPPHQAQIICLDTDSQLFATYNSTNPVSNLQSNNLAYVIYTSGSTGKPKGVLIQHQSLVNYIQVAIEEYQLCPEDRILQFASYSFDTAVEEIFSTLSCGATLVLRTDEMLSTIATFLQRCQDWQITVLDLPTAYWHQLISTLAREQLTFLPPIRLVIIGGERAIPAQVKLWQEYVGNYPRLVNGYGPTEATVAITFYDLSVPDPIYSDIATQRQGEREVPIGRPIQNCQVYILDENLQPVPDGIAGELHIGGIVLARGYLNRPELTVEKFISFNTSATLSDPKLRTMPNPFDDSLGERLYKTGDLVRYLSDGNIEYLGRIDNQVKLRGFRIELEEIEAVLASHSLVQEAVVIVREDIPGEQQLVAYFVCPSNQSYSQNYDQYHDRDSSPPVSASDLRSYLKEKLPDYMVPATFVILAAIPLTPNGKIDRRALPKPDFLSLEADNYLAPRNELEEAIAGIWAEVLQLEKVGVNDNFFDLGGHSLSAIRVITRMQELGVFLSLRDLFTTPTISGLVQERETTHNQNQRLGQPQLRLGQPQLRSSQLSIQPVNWKNNLPLSFAQESLWFLDQLNPQSGFYNIPTALHLQGTLNYQALRQSIQEIIRRHAALRTNFTILDGEVVQVIAPSRELDLKELDLSVVDLQALPTSEQAIVTKKLINTEAAKPFNLAQESLIRVLLLQLKPTEQILVVTMHHIVADGWSMGIFVAELTALYGAFVKGQPSPLPELTIQYPDFAVGQRQWLQGEVLESQIAYWQKQLADAPSLLELPYDRPRPARQTYQGATQSFPLSIELSNAIALLSRKQNATVFMTLVAAFQTLLFRYTQSLDICIGSPIANRNQAEIESLIGFFVNTLVLRTNLAGEPSFEELLSRVKEVALAAYAHQDVPLEKLVEVLQPQRSLSYSPLFQVMFVLQNTGETTWELEGLSIEQLPVETSTAKFDLILSVDETKTGLVGNWEYNTDLFDHATITRMAGHFQILLEGIIAHPQEKITYLPLISTSEQQLFQTWNQTQTDYPKEATIHELFETQVEKTPEAVALVFAGQQSGSALRLRSVTALRQDSVTTPKPEIEPQIELQLTQLTYQELNQRANQLAHYLTTLGVKPEVTVGIFLDRSIDLIVATLAILKAGGVYVPLDPAYPSERLAFMFANAQVEILLTESSLATQFPTPQAKVICLDESHPLISQYSTENLINLDSALQLPSLRQAQGIAETATNLAYIMYTSGSTGQPKGVGVTHRGVVRLVKENNYADLDSSQVFLQLAPTAFDASTLEIWGSLLNGAKLVIPPAHKLSLTEMGQLIQHYQVTILWLTAGLFHLMVDECLANLKPLKQLLAGGDILSVPHVQRFLQTHPHCQLINGYGPTENTTFTCCYRIPEAISSEKSIPIGLPIANTQVYILDPYLQPVPIGVKGELYLGGDGLARGYFERPDLTAERFIPFDTSAKLSDHKLRVMSNPLQTGNYLYKTGDVGRYLPDGNIEFLGRLDNQVKIRGFRIELGEVESVLVQHPQIQQTIVLAQEDMPGEKYLVAYVTLSEDSKQVAVNTGDQYLAAHLSLSEKNNKEENRELPVNLGSQIGGDYLLFEDFRQFLQQKLPDYMMPTTFIILESFPLNAVGKIDRLSVGSQYRLSVGSQYHRALSDSKQIHQGQEKILVAPRDQVEEQLLQIWLQVLGKQEIGIYDRFFEDLGGTSLKAARLFLRIEETFGKVLPLAILYEAPTIALLAKIIRQQEWSPSWSSLVTIQPQGTKIPLFCIHPGGGNVLCYRTLAPYLGADQPVYGLQSRGLDGQEEAIDNIQVMASNYIQEIKTIQPQGPYLLTGYSLGGTIAYEIAQQLQQSGQEVAAVILLDAINPQILRQGATPLAEKLKLHNANLQKLNFPEQWDYFRHRGDLKLKAAKAKLKDLTYYLQGRANPDAIADHLLKLDATNFQALLKYQPQPYTGKVVIFETIERPTDTYYSPSLGWAAFIKYGLEIIDDIPGHHGTMLEEPYVAILGKKLHAYIEQFNPRF